uniref:Uncharacterized protein n=1 Tax=Triticum urartu TaxID=4572 RepID=A0A8R7R6X1_TRIUA
GRHHGCSGVLLEEKEGGRGRGREKTGRKERNEGRHGLPGGDGRGRGRSGALLVQGGQGRTASELNLDIHPGKQHISSDLCLASGAISVCPVVLLTNF